MLRLSAFRIAVTRDEVCSACVEFETRTNFASTAKSPTGKLLRRVLKSAEMDKQRTKGIFARDNRERARL